MLVFKQELKGGILIETKIIPIEAAKWINAHSIEDRIIVFTNIDLGFCKKEQLKKIVAKTASELINEDLTKSEMFTLATTFRQYASQIENKLKEAAAINEKYKKEIK